MGYKFINFGVDTLSPVTEGINTGMEFKLQLPMLGLGKYRTKEARQQIDQFEEKHQYNPFAVPLNSERMLVRKEFDKFKPTPAKISRAGVIRAINSIKPATGAMTTRDRLAVKDTDLVVPKTKQMARLKKALATERTSSEVRSRAPSQMLVSSQSVRQIAIPGLKSPQNLFESSRDFITS